MTKEYINKDKIENTKKVTNGDTLSSKERITIKIKKAWSKVPASEHISHLKNEHPKIFKTILSISLTFLLAKYVDCIMQSILVFALLLINPFWMAPWLTFICAVFLTLLTGIWLKRINQKQPDIFRSFENSSTFLKHLLIFFCLAVVIVGVEYVVQGVFAHFGVVTTTSNQEAINQQLKHPASLRFNILLTIWLAPFIEELAFRISAFRLLPFNNYIIIAYSSLAFASFHSPDNLYAWFIYTSSGLVLGLIYNKFGMRGSFYTHAFYNTIVILLVILGILG